MKAGYWQDEPSWLRCCADPRIFVVACAWLIVLVVLGTVVQKDIGIYLAQERYFSSWLMWLGPVPLPGGRLTLTVTGMNLLAALFTRRGTHNPGLFTLHAGMLLLLGGGLVGGSLRQEGNVAFAGGETADMMISPLHHELALQVSDSTGTRQITIGEDLLRPGAVLSHPDLPGGLRITRRVANCQLTTDGRLQELPSAVDAEMNQPGVGLVLGDGREICVAGEVADLDARTKAIMRGQRIPLPVALELIRASRDNHPGTEMARDYNSQVLVHDGSGSRRVVISMNHPLTVGAWTFYQSKMDGNYSVLAVAHDRFSLSPYISCGVMLCGMILHLILRFWRLAKGGAA